MTSAAILRREIESSLADRIPSALTPRPNILRPVWPTGVSAVDELLDGGLPVGALTEMAGPECSGRTSLALSFVAACTRAGRVCAWVDVSDTLSPESAAASGIQLDRLLWVRCGVSPPVEPAPRPSFHLPAQCFAPPAPIKGLYPGGWGAHPRTETNGLGAAIGDLLHSAAPDPRCDEPLQRAKAEGRNIPHASLPQRGAAVPKSQLRKPWPRMEQAMRATDLLLQTGGFAVVVLDMASLAPETALRVPLATWFRYRAAADRTQTSVVLLTQSACAKSSAGLLLRMEKAIQAGGEPTVFTGFACNLEVARERFRAPEKVVQLRKPPVRANTAVWQARSAWAGAR